MRVRILASLMPLLVAFYAHAQEGNPPGMVPTPRWTACDARRYKPDMTDNLAVTLRERIYTSPIWYTP